MFNLDVVEDYDTLTRLRQTGTLRAYTCKLLRTMARECLALFLECSLRLERFKGIWFPGKDCEMLSDRCVARQTSYYCCIDSALHSSSCVPDSDIFEADPTKPAALQRL